mmetsp:Transcript_31117/g.67214  ORF Transcript_31117/g.67214 Transcript_31117/m.67214 type:complete len:174 (+) Transcript_31117:210-731(+)
MGQRCGMWGWEEGDGDSEEGVLCCIGCWELEKGELGLQGWAITVHYPLGVAVLEDVVCDSNARRGDQILAAISSLFHATVDDMPVCDYNTGRHLSRYSYITMHLQLSRYATLTRCTSSPHTLQLQHVAPLSPHYTSRCLSSPRLPLSSHAASVLSHHILRQADSYLLVYTGAR